MAAAVLDPGAQSTLTLGPVAALKPKRAARFAPSVACPQPLHPKLAQRRLLPEVVLSASSTMSDACVKSLAAAWGLHAGTSKVITFGTACSGSELYTLCLAPLADRLSALTGCNVSFHHVWACELSARKRDWIRSNFKPDHLFRDLKEVATGQAWDVVDGEDETLRRHVPVPAVDILVAGFSCKDASRLNIHHKVRLDAVEKGAWTTGSTFEAFMKLLGGMTPRPRLCLLENVPGLADRDKTTGRSSLDAVHDAFKGQGYLFVHKKFNASDTGIPSSRPRLYMAAIAGLSAIDDGDAVIGRIHSNLLEMLSNLPPRPISQFLLDEYMPDNYSTDEMITDWVPEMRKRLAQAAGASAPAPKHKRVISRLARSSTAGIGRKSTAGTGKGMGSTGSGEGKNKKKGRNMTWAACPHKRDKAVYLADLNGNPWFEVLTAIQKDVLLLNLCQHPYPGLQVGVVTVMTSPKFSRICRDKFPCQVPNAKFWILGHNRLQTGAEALMLQGADLVDIPTFGIGAGRKWSNAFLQDLAGNAFCIYQFLVWLLACLPHIPHEAQ